MVFRRRHLEGFVEVEHHPGECLTQDMGKGGLADAIAVLLGELTAKAPDTQMCLPRHVSGLVFVLIRESWNLWVRICEIAW